MITVNDVLTNGQLSRNYTPEEFMAVMDEHGAEGAEAVRGALGALDSRRFSDVLDATHRWIAYSDFDGRDHAFEMVNDDLLAWVNVYGRSQDLATFEVDR